MVLEEHGGVTVNLDISCETTETDAAEGFQRFWETVVRSTARNFAEKLSMGIEQQLRGYSLHPVFADEERREV